MRKLFRQDVLQTEIERKLDNRAIRERGRRKLWGQLLVDIPLNAATAFIVDIGDPEDMRRLVSGGVNPLDSRKQR